jgi:hypothetical protein
MSTSAQLDVNSKPTLVSAPSSVTLCSKSTSQIVFTSDFSGPSSNVKWYGPGPSYPQAGTGETLSMVVNASKAGAYYVESTSSCGPTTSALVTLSVPVAPTVTVSPSTTKCEGGPSQFIFSASAQGSGIDDARYDWHGPGPGFPHAGSNAELWMNVQEEDAGTYYCKVDYGCQTTTSALVTLTVNTLPKILPNQQPQSTSLCASSTPQTVFTVTAQGGNLQYEWYGPTPTTLCGTGPVLVLPQITLADAGSYFAKVSNGCGPSKLSNVVTLQVSDAGPVITSPPQSIALCESPTKEQPFSISASGSQPLTYTWYGPGGNVIGYGESPYLAPLLAAAGDYHVVVSNLCGTVQSATITLTIKTKPVAVLPMPPAQSTCAGGTAVFLISGGPLPGVTYAWYRGYGASEQFVGAGPTLTILGVNAGSAGGYHIVATNECGSTVGEEAFLSVNPAPQVTISVSPDPLASGFCTESLVTLTPIVSAASGPFTYRWLKNSASNLVGTSAVLNLGGLSEAATYWVEVTSSQGCIGTSGPVDLSSGQDALWTGASGSAFLASGSWQRWIEQDPTCGAWLGTSGASGVCPPLRFGRLRNTGAGINSAVLGVGLAWSMRQLEIEGGASSTQLQRLELAAGSNLDVAQCTTIAGRGELLLLAASSSLGDVTIAEGGRLAGQGSVGAGPVLENRGEILAQGVPGAGDLRFVPDQGSVLVRGRAKSLLRAPSGQAGVTILGSLDLEEALSPLAITQSAKLEVQPDNGVVVSGDVTNRGLIQVQGAGPGTEGELWFHTLVNHGKSATCSSCPNLNTGVWLQGGRLYASGPDGALTNEALAKVHVTATSKIGARFVNRGKLKVNGVGTLLTVQGCFRNEPGGIVQLDVGTTLLLDNLTACSASENLGAITWFGPGICIGCDTAATAAPTLIVLGDLENGPNAQLLLEQGLLQVSGDLRSEITDPHAFDLSNTRVELLGNGAAHQLALAAPDLGSIGDFDAHAAMALGELVLTPNSGLVVLAPQADGSPSVLYVKHLEVAAGSVLELGTSTVYAADVELQPGAALSLTAGQLYYGAINLPDPCLSGQVLGSGCATQLAPLPAPDCDGDGIADSAEIALGTAADCNGNGVPDACDIALGSSLDQDANAVPDDCQQFHADRPWISASQGGKQTLSLHAGAAQGSQLYVVVGSATGTTPGITLDGVLVPLSLDSYTLLTLNSLNKAPFAGTFGLLDPQGRATASIELEGGQLGPSAVGLQFHHAYVALSGGAVALASNPTAVEIRP